LTSSPNCFSNCSINFVAKPKPRKSRSIATCQTNKVSNEVGCLNPDTKPITLSSHSATIDVSLKYLLHIKKLYEEYTSNTFDSSTLRNISVQSYSVGCLNV